MTDRAQHPLIIRIPGWLRDAACKDSGLSIDDFFPPPASQIRPEVLDLCRGCPVRELCLRRAYENGFDSGWWGGLSASLRERLSLEEALEVMERDHPAADADDQQAA